MKTNPLKFLVQATLLYACFVGTTTTNAQTLGEYTWNDIVSYESANADAVTTIVRLHISAEIDEPKFTTISTKIKKAQNPNDLRNALAAIPEAILNHQLTNKDLRTITPIQILINTLKNTQDKTQWKIKIYYDAHPGKYSCEIYREAELADKELFDPIKKYFNNPSNTDTDTLKIKAALQELFKDDSAALARIN